MVDSSGKTVTSLEEIKNAHVKYFEKVLANRPVKSGLEKHQKLREELCIKRIKNAKLNKTPDWDITYVKFVMKKLKKRCLLIHLDIPINYSKWHKVILHVQY